jgi:hypothetical protein
VSNVASAEHALGNSAEDLRQSDRVWTTRKAMLGEDHPDTLISCNNYCGSLINAGRFHEALPLLETSLRILRKLKGPAHPSTLLVQSNIVRVVKSESESETLLRVVTTIVSP